MLGLKTLACFQIQARKREDMKDYWLLFTNPKQGKAIKLNDGTKGVAGISVMGQHLAGSNILLVLTKEGSFCLRFLLIRFPHFKMIKQRSIEIQNNDLNYHSIIRIYSKASLFLFYHESKTDIEVRELISLKLRTSIDLVDICKRLDLTDSFDQLKISLDLAFIPHMGKLVLLLADKIALIDRKRELELIFDCAVQNTKEHLVGLKYDSEKQVIFAVGLSSYFIFELNDAKVCNSKVISCEKLGRRMRLLGWDPREELILIAQRTAENKENFYIADYQAMPPYIVRFCRDQPMLGTLYDAPHSEFLYVEEGGNQNKTVTSLNFENFRQKYGIVYEQNDLEWEIERTTYAILPTISSEYPTFLIKKFKNLLYVRPVRAFDLNYLKDHVLRN